MKRAVIYARLSVSKDASVSIERQLESGRAFCQAKGWEVADEFVDDGVSASRKSPTERKGWSALLASNLKFDAVVIWKIDRLARNTLDFLETQKAMDGRGAGIVAVDGTVDMTNPYSKAMTTVLAAFAELEAAGMSARVRAARTAIIKAGRRPGGRPPFGWMNVENPDGPGFVLAQDPDRIDVVTELVDKALTGASLYSLAKWLTDTGVPTRPRRAAGAAKTDPPAHADWHDASVEAILRSPVLAGMTSFDNGDVLRGRDHLPLIDPSVAVITEAERRQLLAVLDAAKRPGTRQNAGAEPALLYGIACCASCGGLMYRATAAGKYKQYRCQQRGCPRPVGINRPALEEYVVTEVLERRGQERSVTSLEVDTAPDAEQLANIQSAIDQTAAMLTTDGVDVQALLERLEAQKRARAEVTAGASREPMYRVSTSVLLEDWARSDDVEGRRQLLLGHVIEVRISGTGRRGRGLDTDRIEIVWRELTDEQRARRDEQLEVLARIGLRRSGRES